MSTPQIALVAATPLTLEARINDRITELLARTDAQVTINHEAVTVAVVRSDYLLGVIPYLVEPLPAG